MVLHLYKKKKFYYFGRSVVLKVLSRILFFQDLATIVPRKYMTNFI